jgi:hypothetical protein
VNSNVNGANGYAHDYFTVVSRMDLQCHCSIACCAACLLLLLLLLLPLLPHTDPLLESGGAGASEHNSTPQHGTP